MAIMPKTVAANGTIQRFDEWRSREASDIWPSADESGKSGEYIIALNPQTEATTVQVDTANFTFSSQANC
jgi:hypothetical protein